MPVHGMRRGTSLRQPQIAVVPVVPPFARVRLLTPLTSASRKANETSASSSADFTPMAPRSEARLVEDLRDFLDDFAFRAKRLAAPLLRPFGPSAEPAAAQGQAQAHPRHAPGRRGRVVGDEFLRDLEHAAEDVLEELEFEALRSARLEGFKAQLLRSSSAAGGKRKREIILMYSRKIARIMERYNEIARDRDALRLRSGDGERRQDVSPMTPMGLEAGH
nr:unnamed protein product [Digitaria exilis]